MVQDLNFRKIILLWYREQTWGSQRRGAPWLVPRFGGSAKDALVCLLSGFSLLQCVQMLTRTAALRSHTLLGSSHLTGCFFRPCARLFLLNTAVPQGSALGSPHRSQQAVLCVMTVSSTAYFQNAKFSLKLSEPAIQGRTIGFPRLL